MKTVDNMTALIGETPVVRLNRIVPEDAASILSNWNHLTRVKA